VADKSPTELIRIYFKAYETKDRSALESSLSADFTFTSPYDDHIDRATYLERFLASRFAINGLACARAAR
jgi:ketosteroid isomerase-like protein